MPSATDAATQAPRRAVERTFRTHDGVDLFYRHWPATRNPVRGGIVLFHRGHEHSGRMAHLVDELDLPDFDFFAWDARGHGRSPGVRGDSPSFATSVRDVQTFVDHISSEHGISTSSLGVVAQSLGAVAVATWVHDYAPAIRGMVLASPAFRVKLYIPLALPGLALMRRLRGNFFVKSYVQPQFLTRDKERIRSYRTDPLLSRAISVDVLLGLQAAADRVVSDAHAITVPAQILISGDDWVVRHGPQHAFFDRLGSTVKERHVLHGFKHDTFGERDRARAVARARSFLLRVFDAPLHQQSLLDADDRGVTREEADRLGARLHPLSPRGLYWAATRAGLRVGSMLSHGLAIGRATGHNSGATLDYVYRDEARGRNRVGRWIDRAYLNAIGWRGIRQRKKDVEALPHEASARLRDANMPVHIVDVASGHGRYVLDAAAAMTERPASILLRDYDARNVEQARALIRERHLEDVARAVAGDAFDAESLGSIRPRPTLAIVSGLYELVPENGLVRRSLAGLADAIVPGGLLVYTGQPWHPQLELIARTLTSHRNGEPWVMRRRTQAELDQLVAAAGFRKVSQRIGESGIFTVSLAERLRP